jgi:hypothetical protein
MEKNSAKYIISCCHIAGRVERRISSSNPSNHWSRLKVDASRQQFMQVRLMLATVLDFVHALVRPTHGTSHFRRAGFLAMDVS